MQQYRARASARGRAQGRRRLQGEAEQMHQGHLQSRPWPPWHQREAPAVCVPSHGHLGLPHPDTGPDSSPTTCIKHRRHLGSPVQPRHPLRPQHLCQEEPWCCSEMLPLLCCMQDPRLGAAAGCVELAALPFYSNPQTVCVPAPHDHPVAAGLLQKAAGKPTGNHLVSVSHALVHACVGPSPLGAER